jgi:hypothetical protein
MQYQFISTKIVLGSILHLVIVLMVLLLMDIGLYYFLHFVVYKIFSPFNGLNFWFKIFILFIGGYFIFTQFLTFTQRVTSLLGGLIFNRVRRNLFTNTLTYIITIANAVYNIIWIWKSPVSYNFWIVCELLIITFFIWSLNYIVLPIKEQLELYNRDDEIVSRF